MSLSCEKQHREISWLNFSCTSFFISLASRSKLQKESDQNLQLETVVHKNVEYCSQCHGWKKSHKELRIQSQCHQPEVVQATKLGWPFGNTTFCTFPKGLKPVFKCPMFSVESICLSHFGSFFFLFLNNVLDLKIKFFSSLLSPHLINFPKDVV